jgi:hypothetical protein
MGVLRQEFQCPNRRKPTVLHSTAAALGISNL